MAQFAAAAWTAVLQYTPLCGLECGSLSAATSAGVSGDILAGVVALASNDSATTTQRDGLTPLCFVAGTVLVHEAVFVLFNLVLFLFDYGGIFRQYKIIPDKLPPKGLVLETIRSLVISHLVFQPLQLYFLFSVFRFFGMQAAPEHLPSLLSTIGQFAVFFAVNETGFYWTHWLLHTKLLYSTIHKQHHRFNVTIGIASEFAHPFEAFISNGLPSVLGPMLLGSHLAVFWLWLALRVALTVDNHSGYNFPWNPFHLLSFQSDARAHDFHHSHNQGMYGASFKFWDWLMGTDRAFLAHVKEIEQQASASKPLRRQQ